MAATVFYIDEVPEPGLAAVLDGPQGHHAATVRRIGVGEQLHLGDGAGTVAAAEVTATGRDRLELNVSRRWIVPRPTPVVTLVQALPKSERSELAVELATEAGIDEVLPWAASRCVARWTGPKAAKGVQKWQAAARAAAMQSRRPWIPEVADLHDTAAVTERIARTVGGGGIALALHESGATSLRGLPLGSAEEVLLVVGPEGGIDEAELARFEAAGATTTVLGPTVLRTSTAAAVALGALGVLTERWSPPGMPVTR